MSGINIVLAILILGLLVTIHEFGHFAVAKLSGIKVNKFAVGMGPRLFKFTKGDTEYSLRLLPIGGFCAMEGEDESSDDKGAFRNKPVSRRIGVVAAGPIMNLLLGIIVALVMTCISDSILSCRVKEFKINSTSNQTGLCEGDEIIKMNNTKIYTTDDLSYMFQNTSDGVFDLVVKRNGEKVKLDNVKFYTKYYYYIATDEDGKQYYEKFATKEEYTGTEELKEAEERVDFRVFTEEKTFGTVVSYSFKESFSLARLILMSLKDLVTGKYGLNDLSGPVGIVQVIDQARALGLENLLFLVCMLTLNLGIFNLLPLPALDGGRLIFLIIEAVRRKPVPPEKEGVVHLVGMALLMILMVAVTISDIVKLLPFGKH